MNGAQKSASRKNSQHPQTILLVFFVEVDLEYHDVQNDRSLGPEKLKIPITWRSDYANSFGFIVGSAAEKPVETLLDKHHYISQYQNLKFWYCEWIERHESPSCTNVPAIKMARSLRI